MASQISVPVKKLIRRADMPEAADLFAEVSAHKIALKSLYAQIETKFAQSQYRVLIQSLTTYGGVETEITPEGVLVKFHIRSDS